jgi:hypothetical protein
MLTRPFPINDEAHRVYIDLPINADGTPKRGSHVWKTMIANAVAKAPEQRSPAENAAIRREREAAND